MSIESFALRSKVTKVKNDQFSSLIFVHFFPILDHSVMSAASRFFLSFFSLSICSFENTWTFFSPCVPFLLVYVYSFNSLLICLLFSVWFQPGSSLATRRWWWGRWLQACTVGPVSRRFLSPGRDAIRSAIALWNCRTLPGQPVHRSITGEY